VIDSVNGGGKPLVQALVYIFISLAGLAIAAAAYFGLMFTPIEAILTGLVGVVLAIVMLERNLRRRAESRLERGIEDLSRLLSTDAQAGQVLSQRINEMANVDAGQRLEALEADVSVIGTVVQQVAEAVADLEQGHSDIVTRLEKPKRDVAPEDDRFFDEPAKSAQLSTSEVQLTAEAVQQALRDERLVFHVQPVVTLPHRRTNGYDLLPLIQLDDGAYADACNFTPRRGGDALIQQIEQIAWEKAFTLARQARAAGESISIFAPLSRATLADPDAVERAAAKLDSSRAMAKDISFAISERQWSGLNAMEKHALATLVEKGVGVSVVDAKSLRMNFAELEESGVSSVRADATRFINQPETFTDFHSSDVAAYVNRYGIDLIMTGVHSEQQILSLLEDGVRFVQGNYISAPGPVPAHMLGGTVRSQAKRERIRT